MKITKEMLKAWRSMITIDGDTWGDIRRADLHALLDERKALRAEVRRLQDDLGEVSSGWGQSDALALGEDEE